MERICRKYSQILVLDPRQIDSRWRIYHGYEKQGYRYRSCEYAGKPGFPGHGFTQLRPHVPVQHYFQGDHRCAVQQHRCQRHGQFRSGGQTACDQMDHCRQLEEDMRRQVPIEKAPQRALRFLKRVKRTRLIAAILSALVALFCIGWLYDLEFHYANTEAGRLEAVCDYIPSPEGNTISGVEAGTPVRAVSWQTIDNHLLIFFAADNEENVHGVMHLYSVNPVQILFLLCDFHKKYILCVLKLAAVSASHCTLVIKAILTNLFTKTLYISNIELYLANF